MSGHSKWSKIKHKKGAADAKRSNLFTKLTKAVTVAAQQGGGDPEMNFSLRLAIDKAKAGNVPKDNIDRAIKRGTGEDKEGAAIEEVLYEGFGPGGVAILIEVLTDNKNRTVSEIKNILTKQGGSLGGPGSVQWQFERKGEVLFTPEKKSQIQDWDSVQLELMDAGAEDIRDDENGVEIICPIENFKKVMQVINKLGIDPDDSGLKWVAKEEATLDDEASKKVEALCQALDESDDVREVYTNES